MKFGTPTCYSPKTNAIQNSLDWYALSTTFHVLKNRDMYNYFERSSVGQFIGGQWPAIMFSLVICEYTGRQQSLASKVHHSNLLLMEYSLSSCHNHFFVFTSHSFFSIRRFCLSYTFAAFKSILTSKYSDCFLFLFCRNM